MKSEGRPCEKCQGHTRTIDKRERKAYTYRKHRCRECGHEWDSKQYHYRHLTPPPIVLDSNRTP